MMRASLLPHMKKEDARKQVDERLALLSSSYKLVNLQTEEDKLEEKRKRQEQNRLQFMQTQRRGKQS